MAGHKKAPPLAKEKGAFQTNPSLNSTKEATFLIEKMAIAGHAVVCEKDAAFTSNKWGASRYLENLEALQAFARLLGVR